MPKLSDTQLILLSTASQRSDGSFYPFPAALPDAAERGIRAIVALTKRGFAEERETREPASVRRSDGDISYGMFVTEAGISAIDGGNDSNFASTSPPAAKPKRQSKSAAVIQLLKRDDGATLADLIEATSWLPHTTRAALTGLRKKGHAIERSKRNDETNYRITAAV